MDQLQMVFGKHPHWHFLHDTVTAAGSSAPVKQEPNASIQQWENAAAIACNNHGCSDDHQANSMLLEHITKDVAHGYMIPLSTTTLHKIPGMMIGSLFAQQHYAIDMDGNCQPKDRLAHDQSFTHPEEAKSLNDLVDMSKLPELIYGYAIKRIIHLIMALQCPFPSQKIMIAKNDMKAAFCCITMDTIMALWSLSVLDDYSLMAILQTFGGAANPANWKFLSEMLEDAENELLKSYWSMLDFDSPLFAKTPVPQYTPDHIPFALAASMALILTI